MCGLLAAPQVRAAPVAPTAAGGEESLPRVAVMALKAGAGVDEKLTRLLDDVILTEIQKMRLYEVFGQADMVAMVDFEQQRQILGCTDESCLAELGGALGVNLVVFGTLGRLEDIYLLNLKLIDIGSAAVVERVSERVLGGQMQLLRAVETGVPRLFAAAPAAKGATSALPVPVPAPVAAAPVPGGLAVPAPLPAPHDPDVASDEEGTPVLKSWWFWTIVGVVAVGTAAGVGAAVVLGGGGGQRTPPFGLGSETP